MIGRSADSKDGRDMVAVELQSRVFCASAPLAGLPQVAGFSRVAGLLVMK